MVVRPKVLTTVGRVETPFNDEDADAGLKISSLTLEEAGAAGLELAVLTLTGGAEAPKAPGMPELFILE